MRPHSGADIPGQIYHLTQMAGKLKTFFWEAFGASYGDGCEPNCMYDNYATVGYLSPEAPRAVWLWFVRPLEMSGDGNFLHPLPFQVAINQKGQDPEDWSIIKIWYWGNWFDTADQLAAEWAKPGSRLRQLKIKYPTGDEKLYSNFKPRPGPRRGERQPIGPIQFEPYGRRFSISGNKVSWLGWDFAIGNKPTSGPRLWDIRFKGERIVYELSMQEEMAAYGGDDIVQSHTVFLDSHWGVGASVRELVHGVDCPLTAAYMDVATLYKGMASPVVHKNAICVFESDQNMPGLRHYDYAFKFYGGIKSHMLTVRFVSEVYNYDYICDFNFYIDGTIEPRVATSGYIQAAGGFSPYMRGKFGYPLMHNISGSLHTHLMAWKVDFDILGTANSINMHEIGIQKTEVSGLGIPIWNHRYIAKVAATEEETAIKFNAGAPKYPVFINEKGFKNRNKWGSLRGYKFQPMRVLHNLIPEGEGWGKGLGFAKYGFVATVRKELEPDSSSIYSQANLASAPVRLETFINGESARNRDLVAWVTSGLYHIPVSEDAPVTPTVYNHLGFMLVPFNYHDENAAMDMADRFQIDDSARSEVPPVQLYVADANYQCMPDYDRVPFSRKWDPN
ncbi:MAG: copper amine oxidase [Monoraphidium minutum]|nr:MAG: copper amine oxidase [Monoraphidium minutum]